MREAIHIGKATTLAGVSVDTIRFYQKLGLITSTSHSPGGYRLFDREQIHELKFVRAQELGFSLTEVKELLAFRAKASRLLRRAIHAQAQAGGLERLQAELAGALRN